MRELEILNTGDTLPDLRGDQTVAVLMSGGVDSSVTAALLADAGWRVAGFTMRIPEAGHAASSSGDAVEAAARVAAFLGIPHAVVETESLFGELVIAPFREAYARGETPNPCCLCNRALKFGAVWDAIERVCGGTHLATGHYVSVVHDEGRAWLRRDPDNAKDQTYFIYGIPSARLPFFHAPLAGRSKDAVRHLAREYGLPVAERPESMELCFAGGGDYRVALGCDTHASGPILAPDGTRLGTHNGIMQYTIGQRRGIGVAAAEPLYVVAINPAANSITVAPRAQAMRRRVAATLVAVHLPEFLTPGMRLGAKIRSYTAPAICCVESCEGPGVTVSFAEPVFAPTPGQHLVLYTTADADPAFGEGCLVAGGPITGACD